MHFRNLLLSLMLLGGFAFATNAFAQDPVSDDDVNDVASQLFCPTCESIPVDVCPTAVCNDWRAEIRIQLEDGRSEDEILTYFADRYGEGVLASPPASGFGLLVWIAPAVVILGGAFIFWRYLQSLQTASPAPQATTPAKPKSDDPYLDRIAEELENR